MPKEKCPDCGGDIVVESDESYCKVCGLVIDDTPVDNHKANPTDETSAPVTYLNPDIGTSIGDKK
jgi:transcription initiation factor TFIIIB Brf1 subunit/transcription initiation factor TFIIB